ncbi:ABC transporter ATP-binding protein [Lacrimispora sp.]|uniref:ABC transporter ATP-binding protein n=1 Tax=Lacrimispora sp. TaxID=2719234 RepID=UPI0028965CF2|nr:ATP-binding cassette domain-containing protein [Lacrimispora sp.]
MLIAVKNLVKEYRRKKNPETLTKAIQSMIQPDYEVIRAVDSISLSIEAGETVGYVGPNGSGKSTTIKMLSGVLMPTSGSIKINGLNPIKNRKEINKRTGVVFGNRSVLWWDIPIIESFRVLQKLYEIPEKTFKDNLDLFSEVIGIGTLLGTPERQLSLGQKIRCNIAAAFLHNPDIVYLDEPTIGLDSESKLKIREFFHKIRAERNATFIVTSHDFQDIESLCERIILINYGQIIMDEKIDVMRKKFDKKKQIKFEVDHNPWFIMDNFNMHGVKLLHQTDNSLTLECEIELADTMSVIGFISQFCEIRDLSINGQEIESIIREIVRADNQK